MKLEQGTSFVVKGLWEGVLPGRSIRGQFTIIGLPMRARQKRDLVVEYRGRQLKFNVVSGRLRNRTEALMGMITHIAKVTNDPTHVKWIPLGEVI